MLTNMASISALAFGFWVWAVYRNLSSPGRDRFLRPEGVAAANGPGSGSKTPDLARTALPWSCLALFALLGGLSAGLKACGADGWLSGRVIGATISVVAGLTLLEFARRGQNALSRWRCPTWIDVPFLVLAAVGLFWRECSAVDATSRYALVLPGGLWAGCVLWWAASRAEVGRRELRVAAACLAVFSLSFGLVPAKAALLPAARFNEVSFWATVGWPIQAVQALAALAVALSLWRHAVRVSGTTPTSRWPWAAAALLCAGIVWATMHGRETGAGMLAASGGAGQGAAMALAGNATAEERADWSRLTSERWRTGIPIVLGILALLAALVVAGVLTNERPRSRSRLSG